MSRLRGWKLAGWWCGIAIVIGLPAARALDPTRAVKDYHVSEWQVTDGLPYASVNAIAQSTDGYIWLGTRTGLGRFDGLAFTTFTSDNLAALSDDRIVTFFRTRDGTLWAGTGKGLISYRDGRWSRAAFSKPVDEGLIWAISETPDGALLIAVHHGGMTFGLHEHRAGTTREILLPSGKSAPRLNEVRHTPSGPVLAGAGMFALSDGKLTDIAAAAGVEKRQVLALELDHAGTFWIATPVGLVAWDGTRRQTFTTLDGLPSNSVRSLHIDSDRNLWIGTSNGVTRYADGSFEPLIIHGVETLSHTLCFFEDRERNLWVGTDNGLLCLRDPKVTTFTQRDGLPVNPTLCILPAKDGTQWIGTIGGGLAHVTPAGVRTLKTTDGLAEDSIGALAEDASGGLWIAYYTRGVSYYKDGVVKHYATGDPVRVRGLAVGADGSVWAAHSSRVFKLVDDAFEPVLKAGEIEHFRALHIAPDGAIWVSSGQTLSRYRDGAWTHFPTPADVRDQHFQHIFSTSDGAIWGLQDGPILVRIANDRRDNIPLPAAIGPLIYSGFEHRGELWISFRTGIGRIRLDELEAVRTGRKSAPAMTIYNEADGMRSRAPNNIGSPGSVVMADGSLWFATSMGIAIIHPDRIRLNLEPPSVVIEHVFADKVEYAPDKLGAIPPGRGEIAFQFTTPTFVNPLRARFKYRLHGFDRDWIDAGRRREAYYGGLPPGSYRFEVMAANNEGVWTAKSTSCGLVLLPHFYQRWWFYAAVGMAVAGAGVGTYQWRSRRLQRRALVLQRQNDELERRIAERTAELRVSYDALRASEYFYHSLVESLPQVIVRKDATGRYTYANPAFAELRSRPLHEILGRTDDELFPPDVAAKAKADDQRVLELRQPLEYEEIVEKPGEARRYLHVKKVPLFDASDRPLGVQLLFWDMTVFRETEHKLKHAQRELVEISRLAGIAEMATGVLHNLGNALNSVKVAATVALTKVHRSSVGRVRRVSDMLQAERHRLPEYFATDERAAKLPDYLQLVAEQLETERTGALHELESVAAGIEHVAQLVAAQQENARITGIIEEIAPSELMEYACRMSEATLCRHEITVVREFMPVPPIVVERQKALQILGNLIRNAGESLVASDRADKRITLRVHAAGTDHVHLSVSDNGLGIPEENLKRIFEFGFTSKKNGHGFGLHNSALAARELGGKLEVRSGGLNQGATFILAVPLVASHSAAHIGAAGDSGTV